MSAAGRGKQAVRGPQCILREMKRVLTAAVLIPLVLLLILKGSFPLLTIVCAIVAGLAAWELLGLADASGAKTPRLSVLAAIGGLFLCAYLRPEYLAPVLGALSFFLFLVCAFRSPAERVLLDTGSSLLALVYTGFAMVALPLINRQENGPSLLLLLLLVVWTGGHCRAVCRARAGTAQAGACDQPQQDLGGKSRFGRRQPAHRWRACWRWRRS